MHLNSDFDQNFLDHFSSTELLPVLGSVQQEFLQAISKRLLSEPKYRSYRGLVAFGYWLRKIDFEAYRDQYLNSEPNSVRKPRGNVLHFAPANVPLMGLYSWVPSLLMGNRNIIRFSMRSQQEVTAALDVLHEVLKTAAFQSIDATVKFVSYAHSDAITAMLSRWADTRMMWGGDKSIVQLRSYPIKPSATDIAFPNKVSLAVLNAERWSKLDVQQKDRIARQFAVDSLTYYQQACSSPTYILWTDCVSLGQPQLDFWERVEQACSGLLEELTDRERIDRLIAVQSAACRLEQVQLTTPLNSKLARLSFSFEQLADSIALSEHVGNGLFYETIAPSLETIFRSLPQSVQTVSYFGFSKEELGNAIAEGNGVGVDRVVPIGQALDFDLVWDGTDLLEALSKRVTIR